MAAETWAVVLSGGGPVGIAFETGVAAGLLAEGVDLRSADAFVGTSAGSVVGAQLANGDDIDGMVERIRSRVPWGSVLGRSEKVNEELGARLIQLLRLMLDAAEHPEGALTRIGAAALGADVTPEEQFVSVYEPVVAATWPPGFRCTAIDAHTGEFSVWGPDSGVDPRRACASSSAVPLIYPPVTIKGRRWFDGGFRSSTNADVAAGHDRVLVVTVSSQAPTDDARLAAYQRRFRDEIDSLVQAGAAVEVIAPDADAVAAMGLNLMDFDKCVDGLDAGLRVGRAEAARVAALLG